MPLAVTGPALTLMSRSRSANRSPPCSLTNSEANAVSPSTSSASPVSATRIDGLASSGSRFSISPWNFALPRMSSRSLNDWRSVVRSTFALKPAAGSRRIASSTSFDTQAAKPDGWATATSSEPAKPKSLSPVLSSPDASSVVRPGSDADSALTCQPSGAGSACICTSRIVVSPATTAGRSTSIEPGIDGFGRSSSAARIALTRSCSVSPAASLSATTASSKRTCAPVAVTEKRGSASSST